MKKNQYSKQLWSIAVCSLLSASLMQASLTNNGLHGLAAALKLAHGVASNSDKVVEVVPHNVPGSHPVVSAPKAPVGRTPIRVAPVATMPIINIFKPVQPVISASSLSVEMVAGRVVSINGELISPISVAEEPQGLRRLNMHPFGTPVLSQMHLPQGSTEVPSSIPTMDDKCLNDAISSLPRVEQCLAITSDSRVDATLDLFELMAK